MKCRTRGCCVCYSTRMFTKTPFKNTGCWVKQECNHFNVYLFTSVLSLCSNCLLYRTLTAASEHSWIHWDLIRLSHWLCGAQSVGSQTWIKVCLQEKLHRKPLCWPLNKPPWSAVSESLLTHVVQPKLVQCHRTFIVVQVKRFPPIQNMSDWISWECVKWLKKCISFLFQIGLMKSVSLKCNIL